MNFEDETELVLNYRKHKHLIPHKVYFSTNLSLIRNKNDYAIARNQVTQGRKNSSAVSETSDVLPAVNNEANSNRLYISNISFDRAPSVIEQYGVYLAGTKPKKIGHSKRFKDVWVLEFENPIGKISTSDI